MSDARERNRVLREQMRRRVGRTPPANEGSEEQLIAGAPEPEFSEQPAVGDADEPEDGEQSFEDAEQAAMVRVFRNIFMMGADDPWED